MHISFIIIGYIGTLCLSLSYIPQVKKVFKNETTTGISNKFLILQFITCICFIIYPIGFLLENSFEGLPIMIANVFIFVMLIIIQHNKRRNNEQNV